MTTPTHPFKLIYQDDSMSKRLLIALDKMTNGLLSSMAIPSLHRVRQ